MHRLIIFCNSETSMFVFYHVYYTSVPLYFNFISPLSTLLLLMFVISCVCQLFNKECMMISGLYVGSKYYKTIIFDKSYCKNKNGAVIFVSQCR